MISIKEDFSDFDYENSYLVGYKSKSKLINLKELESYIYGLKIENLDYENKYGNYFSYNIQELNYFTNLYELHIMDKDIETLTFPEINSLKILHLIVTKIKFIDITKLNLQFLRIKELSTKREEIIDKCDNPINVLFNDKNTIEGLYLYNRVKLKDINFLSNLHNLLIEIDKNFYY